MLCYQEVGEHAGVYGVSLTNSLAADKSRHGRTKQKSWITESMNGGGPRRCGTGIDSWQTAKVNPGAGMMNDTLLTPQ